MVAKTAIKPSEPSFLGKCRRSVLVRTVEDGLGLLRDLFAVNIPELVLTHPDWFARLRSTVLQPVIKRR